jgi:hypothetical protein
MGKRLAFLVLAAAFSFGSPTRAVNITWVTESVDINGDGVPDDFAWITWLQELGHTVDVQRGHWTSLDGAKIAALNAADVIIISRTATSANYNTDATEVSQWSALTAPILNLNAYFARNIRWYWANTSTINNLVGPRLEVVAPTHPIFTGLQLDGANQVGVVDGTTGTGQTSFLGTLSLGNGTLLAKTGSNAWIVEWPPGKPFYAGSSQTPAGRRMLFCAGTQEAAPQPQGAFNLTEKGKKLLNNAILYLAGQPPMGGQAVNPKPTNGQTDVPCDGSLSWMAGESARTHDVYLGLSATDVGNASRTKPLGVLVSQDQNAGSFAPAGLPFGQTYYWRVDEVDASGAGITKGAVWHFTVEPFAYAIQNVTALASSAQTGMGPENTVNGAGLDQSDQHGTDPTTMWLSTGAPPNWIEYHFDKVYKLHELWVWNSNRATELLVGSGAKDVTVEYSTDGHTWTVLPGVPPFAQATGTATYTHNTTVNFGGVFAQYVKLTINSTWGSRFGTGLAEVRFFAIPVQARAPQPAAGASAVDLDVTLTWRPGREAGWHTVYLDADQDAVANGTAPSLTVADHTYTPASLLFGTTYYWRVDEIGAAATPGLQAGEVWSFTTREYAVIDDFESYNDTDHRLYDTWIDGVFNDTGSLVGYLQPPYAEQTIVHGGRQSMPFAYDNTKTPYYSETDKAWEDPQDWTRGGADTLVLYVRGMGVTGVVQSANSPGQLYVMVRDSAGHSKLVNHPDPRVTTATSWQQWRIPLGSFTGVNLAAVQRFYLGVGDRVNPKAGGAGLIYLDDIGFGHPAAK